MRIHTSLERHEMHALLNGMSGVYFHRLNLHGSRKAHHAFDVIISGTSSRQGNSPDGYQAATWDEWGIFLNKLFIADPAAVTPYYGSPDEFHWVTTGRFHGLAQSHQCPQHKWDPQGSVAGGRYYLHACRKCDAQQRTLAYGTKFVDLTL